ncbi:MAG: nucleoside 2-deoxyribosyltransferase [Lactobacillus sp.]|jgi:nucleoside 2-deoxyribosyltransferase|uniref:Nucleoside 2-deoxyribosyltransferase n=1 Tax=Bombilactobacillus bombi TaxID=1303590 RepID=A0A347SPR2_9LACO|nr:nucleoside 2-deoxyribosyltransferase [Bombilactobacillus bombi]MCO6540943.1 nucleoside 2-deoxyribosyltransferase [Lactobacillus sp.]AXX64021.1 nucleoside 2-deoxyribosyltransferase [Bombilactobacillus bombi]MCO6542595.1 nucleoside 2-deoxyribosyltransferase [Lactobacillus sp.]RHW47795.1 nucleoside 2-deoxyribosyltransferase [Bombilactobacillus bombi]RHW51974.1 nucleoside 2-deoxyribosyltransferase [Bombilactobacillus bombi]
MKIYFANALFSQAEINYNAQLAQQIRQLSPDIDLYLPQENGDINDKQAYADSTMIAQADTEQLVHSDLMVAILDGNTIDNGVATEIGVAYAKQIPVIGLYTDTRQQGADNQEKLQALSQIAENQFHYLNLYTTGLIKLNGTIVNNEPDLLAAVKKYLN